MKLPEYSSFEEKSQNFILHYIDTIDDIKKILVEHQKPKGVYRGVSNAGYKIYSSLQRQIIGNGLKTFNTEKYITETRKQLILKKYFQTFNIVPSKLSIWSYLQHYGAPTPLIDFTFEIKNAFYFAMEKFDSATFTTTDTVGDRFSILFIENSNLELIEIDNVFKSFKEYKILSEKIFKSFPPDKDFDYDSLLNHLDTMFDINVLSVFLLKHDNDFIEIFNAYNNIRIIAQSGLFIHNSMDTLPLEEALKKFFIEATQFQHSPWDDIDTPQAQKINEEYEETLIKNKENQKRLEKNIIHSFEIRKDLIPEILALFEISKKDIYPNEEELAWEIFEKAKK